MRIFIIVLSLLTATSALAQAVGTPSEQAMGTKLMQEIQGGLNCSADLIAARSELAKAQARIKELEAKAEKPKE